MSNWTWPDTWGSMAAWSGEAVVAAVTIAECHTLWPDSRNIEEPTLAQLLASAWEQCAEYLPAAQLTPPPTQPPARWAHANVLQARDVYEAGRRQGGASDVIVGGEFAIRVRALSSTVKALLRPPAGRPKVG